MGNKLNKAFFKRSDVVQISKDLIGKYLYTKINDNITGGIIVETEAYCGSIDRASHAYPDKITPRTKVMFAEGGRSYVYLCYGIHFLFNIVTNVKGKADAILIRALEPTKGIEVMKKRRNISKSGYALTGGPGKLTQALGIDLSHNSVSLDSDLIWLEDLNKIKPEIVSGIRIGVDYAGKDALLPWRFYMKDNACVSRK